MRYTFTVEVDADTYDEAIHVMDERILHDEDYGFRYAIDYAVPDAVYDENGDDL